MQENSETVVSWVGRKNLFIDEEVGGDLAHKEADKSNRGDSLANLGCGGKV